jgi:Cu+-exporting ATPase
MTSLEPVLNSNGIKMHDFSYLDQPRFKEKYSTLAEPDAIRFYVGGIRCGKCVRKLEDLPMSTPGLLDLRVELAKNIASAKVDPNRLSFSGLAQKIMDLGFTPIPLTIEQDEEKAERLEDRQELIRLAVAGACAGNIMTFSFATYLGDTGFLLKTFTWLSFMLYLPVVTYVAWPFYRGAWYSLKQRQLSIDLPMALASLGGFVFSTLQLVRGRDDIYFDSLSGFLFLILLSRWAQRRLQRKFLRSSDLSESLHLDRSRKWDGPSWVWVPTDSLSIGDKVLALKGETISADGTLESDNARLQMSWLTGELKSKLFLKGSSLPAGAKLLSEQATISVSKTLSESHFGKILEEVKQFSLSRNRVVSLSDKWAQWLLLSVFTIALLFLAAYWPVSSDDAISRSLALLILACPCAMAFGTPLALTSAMKRAQKQGLLVRDANVFEKLQAVRTVFFDKTGTLTDTDLKLIDSSTPTSIEIQRTILSLENQSVHPIAFAFRAAYSVTGGLAPVSDWKETAGRGVSGVINGKLYEIKKTERASGTVACELFEEGRSIQIFSFEENLKPDALSVLQELRQRGYKVKLLSGDRQESVEALAKKLLFSASDVHYEKSPFEKAELVSQHKPSIMIGDGTNDSLAMIQATVGVSTAGGVEAALKSSQVYLTQPSLVGVLKLFDISQSTFRLIKQNLIISAFYNVLGGTFALLGYVNPLVAAVLMPISSGFILLSTWLGGRK